MRRAREARGRREIAEELLQLPLDGRRIWFVGIGGAGLSAYALSRRPGAPRSRAGTASRRRTSSGSPPEIDVVISPEPVVRDGWEASCRRRSRKRHGPVARRVPRRAGRDRAVDRRRRRARQDDDGGMIAFVLDRLGRDPAFLIGGEVPQLAANARAGEGWLVVEGDESDRTIASLRPEIAVVHERRARPPHGIRVARRGARALRELARGRAADVVRGDELEPYEASLRSPASTTGAMRPLRSQRSSTPVSTCARRGRCCASFAGAGRRWRGVGVAGGVRIVRRLCAPSRRDRARRSPPLREPGIGRMLVLFQPHLYSRTRHLARELRRALAERTLSR